MGPEGKHVTDVRLDALQSWKQQRAEPEVEPSLVQSLVPLFLAQGMDVLSTERPMGFLTYPPAREANPLPGMNAAGAAGTSARLGWGALENVLVAALLQRSPKLGKAVRNAAVGTHSAMVLNNEALKQQRQGNPMRRADIVAEMMGHGLRRGRR